jgi:hypothetical protein
VLWVVCCVYLGNRKRVACVYCVLMHSGNVWRLREKPVNTGVPEWFTRFSASVLQTFPECIITLQMHETSFSISFISRICYIGNNFTQKIDIEILLTYNQWRHAHALLLLEFLSEWSSKVAKIIQTFDAI